MLLEYHFIFTFINFGNSLLKNIFSCAFKKNIETYKYIFCLIFKELQLNYNYCSEVNKDNFILVNLNRNYFAIILIAGYIF